LRRRKRIQAALPGERLLKDFIRQQNSSLQYSYKEELLTTDYLPKKEQVRILITSGVSCPDALVKGVIKKLVAFYLS
jgi:4-hydroxy-3-methylbut-2-enyl diphosphate reductase